MEVLGEQEGDGEVEGAAGSPVAVEEDDSVFESARESADQDDSIMEDHNDTVITEPTPSKPTL